MCNTTDARALLRALTNELTRNHRLFISHDVGNGIMHMQYYRTAMVYHRMVADYFTNPDHHDRNCSTCTDAHNAYDTFQLTIDAVTTDPIS